MTVGRDQDEIRATPASALLRILVGLAVAGPFLILVLGYFTLSKLHELGDRTLDAVDGFVNARWN